MTGATASDLIRIAEGEVGVTEYPPESNRVKYNTWFYGYEVSGDAYPWCAAFINWLFEQADARELYYGGSLCAGCTTLMNYHKARGEFVTGDYRPGDLLLMCWCGQGDADHIGIVTAVEGNVVHTIEGNTSITSNDNGGAVMRRERSGSCIVGAIRPQYAQEEESMTYGQFKGLMAQYEQEQRDEAVSGYAAEAWEKAKKKGLIDGTMPRRPVLREQLAIMLDRLSLLN